MARYGYDDVAGYGRAWRGGRRRSRGRRFDPDAEYADDFGEFLPMGAVDEVQEQMGMRDFSERYGRYSGGSPYAYEYSERTILHRPEYYGPRGFSRPLGEDRYLRGRRLPPSSPERSRPAVPRERRRRGRGRRRSRRIRGRGGTSGGRYRTFPFRPPTPP